MDSAGFRLIAGVVLSCIFAWVAYRKRALDASGMLGAVLLGTAIFGFGGWVWGGVLIAFFVSSSLLSRYRQHGKEKLAEKFAKGSRRDLGQTMANGGLAGILAVLVGIVGKGHPLYPAVALAFYGSMAAANADTWATELGVLSAKLPRMITTRRVVPVGTSGGVTATGLVAAAGGAAFIGVTAFLLIQGASWVTMGAWLLSDWIVVPITAIGGMMGAIVDSLLGATFQGIYYCEACGVETERTTHRCGRRTSLVRGWRWLDNDGVNFLASTAGALVSACLVFLVI